MRKDVKVGRYAKPRRSKLTDEQVIKIFWDTREQKYIALEYGVSDSCISSIKTGSRWPYLIAELKKKKMEGEVPASP